MQTIELIEKVKWDIDTIHSTIGFKVKHLVVSTIRGEFKKFGAGIYTTGEDFLSARIDLSINPASVTTGDAARDVHVKGAEFFDVENFKEINFRGSGFEAIGGDMYALDGELTIKNITKKIRLDVEFNGIAKDPWGGQRAGFVVTGKINRKDWGLTWSAFMESGGLVVGEDILIYCEIELVKPAKKST